LIIAKIVERLP